jgi:hypothetical protein
MFNFVFFEMVCLVWKTRSRFVQWFKKVIGCDYSQLFSTLLWNYTNRCDIGISNKSCFGQIFVIPKIVKSREITNIQKVFELTVVLVEIFMFFLCENHIETPLVYVRSVDPSGLSFSLSSHRHTYVSLLCSSHFIDHRETDRFLATSEVQLV